MNRMTYIVLGLCAILVVGRGSRADALEPRGSRASAASPAFADENRPQAGTTEQGTLGNVAEGNFTESPKALRFEGLTAPSGVEGLLAQYETRKQGIKPNEFDKHLDVADWCVQAGLIDQAKAEASSALTADEVLTFKKAFIFCVRNKLESVLLEKPSKYINPKLLAMKAAGDPDFRVYMSFLELARQVRDAPSHIAQIESEIRNLPQQRQALEDQSKSLSDWLARARGRPRFSPCPVCGGTGWLQTMPPTQSNPFPLGIPYIAGTNPLWGYVLQRCPNCGGMGLLPNAVQSQMNQAEAQQADIARKLAALDDTARELDENLDEAKQQFESALDDLEAQRAELLRSTEGKAATE